MVTISIQEAVFWFEWICAWKAGNESWTYITSANFCFPINLN